MMNLLEKKISTPLRHVAFFLFFSLFFSSISSNLFAAAYKCETNGGEKVTSIHGATSDAGPITYTTDKEDKKWRYFRFKTQADGEITVTYEHLDSKLYKIQVGSLCGDKDIYNGPLSSSDTVTFPVTKGTWYYIRVGKSGPKRHLKFRTTFRFVTSHVATDLAITNLDDTSDPVAPGEDITYTLSLSNNGDTATNIELNLSISDGSLKTPPSGWSCSGTDNVVCHRGSDLADGESENITFVFSAPSTPKTVTLQATIEGSETDPDPGNNSATTTTTVASIVEEALDLCYDSVSYEGRFCVDLGLFKGGVGCTQTIAIKNWRNYDLQNVKVDINISGYSGNVFSDCGIDGASEKGTECEEENTLDFGPVGILNRAIAYDLQDLSSGERHTIYNTSLVSGAIFSGRNLFATYTRNGTTYRGVVEPCVEGYCAKNGLDEGFHVIDPDGGDTNNSFEIYCDRTSRFAPRDLIALPIKNDFNNFVFNNESLGSTDYYSEALNNSAPFQAIEIDANTMEVITRSDEEPVTTSGYSTMGKSFSNINLTATPFAIDWDHTTISRCTESKLRKAYYGQDVKINTLDYDKAICDIDTMKLKLLDDYQYLSLHGSEVLERTCKELSEQIPIDIMPSSAIKGHYWITPHENTRLYAKNNILAAAQRPIVAYCWYQTDLNWAWTFLLAMDGKRTISKDDLTNGRDTCSSFGLWPFVPNTEETFERVRRFLYDNKTQWENYTGTIEEKVNALYGLHYYLYKERNSLIWPYGSFGVYYDRDSDRRWGGEDVGSTTHHPGPMSGSPMHNIETITTDYPPLDDDEGVSTRDYYSWGRFPNDGLYSSTDTTKDNHYTYEDTMGAKGWVSILGSQDLNITDTWFISRTGAGENFDHADSGYPYYEPNGNYNAGCWLNFLFDSKGHVRHLDDWDCNYPYYDYMCMADTNYILATRAFSPAGLFNVVMNDRVDDILAEGIDPVPEDTSSYRTLYLLNAIPTQIAGKPFSIRAVSLALSGGKAEQLNTFRGLIGLEMIAQPAYAPEDSEAEKIQKCTDATRLWPETGVRVVPFHAESFSEEVSFVYPYAHQDVSFRIKFVKNPAHPDQAIQWDCNASTLQCIWDTLSNKVNTTTCEALCNPSSPTAAYDACVDCVFLTSDLSDAACARDDFAIRPARFTLSTTTGDYPHLMRAGRDYNLTLKAIDHSGANTREYNLTDPAQYLFLYSDTNLTLSNQPKLYLSDGSVDSAGVLHAGILEINASADFLVRNGISVSSSGANEVLPIRYDEVGSIGFAIVDQNWSYVDIHNALDLNDTPPTCDETGAYICGEMNMTFIPHHFSFDTCYITNKNGPGKKVTYLSNDYTRMGARFNIRVSAKNAGGETTRNFSKEAGFYEHPVSVTPSIRFDGYDYPVAMHTTISEKRLGFSEGNKTIPWNETNGSLILSFNFRRDANVTRNPFDINASKAEINITLTAHYIDPSTGNDANISGRRGSGAAPVDGNATFVFGRLHAPDYKTSADSITTPVYAEIFSDQNLSERNRLGVGSWQESVDDVNWWINPEHTGTDGNISNMRAFKSFRDINDTSIDIAFTADTFTNGVNDSPTVTYTGSNRPHKTLIRITTQEWLQYHRFIDDPSKMIYYHVEFIGEGGWAGIGQTGETIPESNMSSERIEW